MQTENIVDENIEFLQKKFANCIVEGKDENGNITKMVDFDLLKQELSKVVVDGDKERFIMNWPEKKQAILTANSPISKTLRPCKEKSVDFENTKNIYIEGDNLDVLKLLRETYLGKVKMIYIDPPYNTGNDFVYNDDFATDSEDYLERSNQVDEEGNRMVLNSESNGRFHTDWLNMIYPRLKVAKDLLTDDGVIFISIDDNEQANLKKVCDEIFGVVNFVGVAPRKTRGSATTQGDNELQKLNDYLLVYFKNKQGSKFNLKNVGTKQYPYSDDRGKYYIVPMQDNGPHGTKDDRPNLWYPIYQLSDGTLSYEKTPEVIKEYLPAPHHNKEGCWMWSKPKFDKDKRDLIIHNEKVYIKHYFSEDEDQNKYQRERLWLDEFQNAKGTLAVNDLFEEKGLFSNPKPLELLDWCLRIATGKNDIILDFFSGSGTTAHSVMKLNSEDGGNRKFILVQLPEECDPKSDAIRFGYKTICQIGEERIRRAGKKIKEGLQGAVGFVDGMTNLFATQEKFVDDGKTIKEDALKRLKNFDIGFRVFKLDSSNMKDTYYKPSEYSMSLLDTLDENIKPDRTPEDLLFQVMLDLGLMLDSKIEEKNINGKKVFIVGDYNEMIKPDLMCCFDSNIDNATVTEIAKMQPRFAVFRDSSLSKDSVAVNFDQIFETYSPSTTRKVL